MSLLAVLHTCTHTASIPTDIGHEMNGILGQNETVRYNLQIPVIGVTVEVCACAGRIVVYGSSSNPNPNSAFYEFFLEVVHENDSELCNCKFHNQDTPLQMSSRKTRNPRTVQSEKNTLFLTVVGKDKKNSFFRLNSTAGDLHHDNKSKAFCVVIGAT